MNSLEREVYMARLHAMQYELRLLKRNHYEGDDRISNLIKDLLENIETLYWVIEGER